MIHVLQTQHFDTLETLTKANSITTQESFTISPIKLFNFIKYVEHEIINNEKLSNYCRLTMFLFVFGMIILTVSLSLLKREYLG